MIVRCATALSRHPVAAEALGEVLGRLLEHHATQADVAVVFFTHHHAPFAGQIAHAVRRVVDARALVGASAAGVFAGSDAVEDEPGLVVWMASGLPDARATTIGPDGAFAGGMSHGPVSGTLLLLADPFSFPVDAVLRRWDREHPELRVTGGLASAAAAPGGNRLLCGSEVHRSGAVAVHVPTSPLPFEHPRLLVSPGCRPIGRPWVVTAAHGHLLLELGGQPALERLTDVLAELTPDDRELVGRGVTCGLVIDEHRVEFERGDFLIRPLLGADRERGALVLGDTVTVGTTVQFHVHDASTAADDLHVLIAGAVAPRPAAGALVFTCTGRGAALFGESGHDGGVVANHAGAATAGMFCGGEFGPVAGRNHLHGFTASVAVFSAFDTVAT